MQKEYNYNNSIINYTDIGNGEIIVLLHGFGEDSNIWVNQIAFLKQHYRLIVPNLPGSGNSTILQQTNVSISDYAICIKNLLNNITNFSNEKISILGHSMGGYITLSFAQLFPNCLKQFALIHSTAFADTEEKKQNRLRGIEMMREYGAYAFLKNTISNLFSNNFKQHNGSIINNLIEQGKYFTIQALEQYYTAMINRNSGTDTLKNINIPVLFVMGTEDVAAPLTDVLQQCYLPKVSYIKILQNVGHMGMLEATTEVNNTIMSFFNMYK